MRWTQTSARFLDQLRNVPDLDREREAELARRWRHHRDRSAADLLIRSTLKHVIPTAIRYLPSGEPLPDLIAEGSLGLLHALDKFDPERGNRFYTYARHWVRVYISRYVQRCRSVVSTPLHDPIRLYAKIRRERARLLNAPHAKRTGPERVTARVARRLGISPEQVRAIEMRFSSADVSLDAPIGHDSALVTGDTIASAGPDPAAETLQREMRWLLLHALEQADLDHGERYVIEQRLLADPGTEPSLAQMGKRLGVSREWARRLEQSGLVKVEKALEALVA